MEILAAGLAEQGAAAPSESRGSSSYGRLPNLSYASSGILSLRQHSRYSSLDAAGVTGETVQRTAAWHAERSLCVTASSGVGFLGLKSAAALKELAAAGLKIYPKREKNELGFRVAALLASQTGSSPPKEKQLTGWARVAMAMGIAKESDVLLTYVKHMDACM